MSYQLLKEKTVRFDKSPEKRVELHLHTNMSALDGISSTKTLIERAVEFGQHAIAITDHNVVQAFPEASRIAQYYTEKGKPIKIIYGMEAYLNDFMPEFCSHVILLAKNQSGLKNLYKLVSWSHLENLSRGTPYITKEKLTELRKGLIVGSGCESGELFHAIAHGKSWDKLCRIAKYYDYLEIQPIYNWRFREYNQTIVRLGEELNIPVCATGNVHFCDPEDEVLRRIILHGCGSEDADEERPMYLRTTDEMLEEFAYLGEKKAYEVVVTNPNSISNMVEDLQPIRKGYYSPNIEGADEELEKIVSSRAKTLYGDPLPEIVSHRLEHELKSILENNFASDYIIAKRLVEDSLSHGFYVGSRGSTGSSLVSFLAGITEVNPLPPHYICPKCRHTEFFTNGTVGSGYDLPAKTCPVCGADMKGDGHQIPFETFAGAGAKKAPDFDLNFAEEYKDLAEKYFKSILGDSQVLFGSGITKIGERTVKAYISWYAEKHSVSLSEEETEMLAQELNCMKIRTGYNPCKLLLIPNGMDVEDFTQLQYYANNKQYGKIISHFDSRDLHNHCMQIGAFMNETEDLYQLLEKTTGVKICDVPLNDPAVYDLLTSPKVLGITPEEIDCNRGTMSLREFSTPVAKQIVNICQPKTFSDFVKISGLLNGTGVWFGNGQDLIEKGVCTLDQIISIRDDIILNLTDNGIDIKTAYQIMKNIQLGRADQQIMAEYIQIMQKHGLPQWYIESIKKIYFLFPKSHAVANITDCVRLAWYKLYYPNEYYDAYFKICT